MNLNPEGIPIIGRTRTWEAIEFVAQPMVKPPTVAVPGMAPEIIGWTMGFVAKRSDGFPVRSLCIVDVGKLGPNREMQMIHIFKQLVDNLTEFLACDCTPNVPCSLHKQTAGKTES